jgi:hypothetical protein
MGDGRAAVVIELRVYAMNSATRVWTIRHTTTDMDEACERAAALRQAGLRVFVRPHKREKLTVKPAYHSESWRHRHEAAGQMLDRADAKKRYKSMG